MIIMKFGGSSLRSTKRVQEVSAIIQKYLDQCPVVVLSAMGDTTDELVEAGKSALQQNHIAPRIEEFHRNIIAELGLQSTLVDELLFELSSLLEGIFLIKDLTPKTHDTLLSFGERLSVRIVSAYLNKLKITSSYFDGWDIGILTSSDFTHAEILPETYERIRENFKEEKDSVPVVTGFIAKDRKGNVTSLGRGGSDLTASVIGRALRVDEVQLWKDVDGILSADPRIALDAKPIPKLSFEEAAELAYFGAEVLHPTSILPAMHKGIPVRVKNHQNPDHPGTLILDKPSTQEERVVAIAHKSHQILIHITSTRMLGQSGFLATVFKIFAELKLSVDVIATSEVSISLTLSNRNKLSLLEEKLQRIATIKIKDSRSIVSLIGKIEHSSVLLEKIMRALNEKSIDIQMISHGASQINTSLIINDEEVKCCVSILYQYFFKEGMSS